MARKRITITIDADLIDRIRAHKKTYAFNISNVCEMALKRELKHQQNRNQRRNNPNDWILL